MMHVCAGVIDGKYYGRPIVETGAPTYARTGLPYAGGYRSSTAAALDAADGMPLLCRQMHICVLEMHDTFGECCEM